MSTPPIRRQSLPATTGSISHERRSVITRVAFHDASLIRVQSGRKTLRWAANERSIEAGELIAVAGRQTFDMVNEADGDSGIFRADWISFSARTIDQFGEQHDSADMPVRDAGMPLRDAEVSAAFDRVVEALQPGRIPPLILDIRLTELLAWLRLRGIGYLTDDQRGLTRQIRKAIAANPGFAWTTQAMAARFHMSEATLRRQLADEQASFRDLLAEVRLMRALTLLQVTEWPISQVAATVGYESASRFSARFRERFGKAPTEVRNTRQGERLQNRLQDIINVGPRP